MIQLLLQGAIKLDFFYEQGASARKNEIQTLLVSISLIIKAG